MEEKKLNELSDEALDAVTGGAGYKFNEETGQYDVFDEDGKRVASFSDIPAAEKLAKTLTLRGR